MNRENIQELINMMSKVTDDEFDIMHWTHGDECGSPSCVAGWAATTPSWLRVTPSRRRGMPRYGDEYGSEAFALWADIGEADAEIICGLGEEATMQFYGLAVHSKDDDFGIDRIKPEHVVKALTEYMEAYDA